jgi:hypothetical protein
MKNLGSYTLGDQYVSPQNRLSRMLLQQGTENAPSYSWQETMGRLSKSLLGAYMGMQDQKQQDAHLDTLGKQQPDVYKMQPSVNDQQIMESQEVQNLLRPTNDETRMQNPNIQRNMNAIGYEQDRISQAENRLKSFNKSNYLNPESMQRDVQFENDAIGRANNNIETYGDEFTQAMARMKSQEPTDEQRASGVEQEIFNQRKASEVDTLQPKMPQRDFMIKNLRAMPNNTYAKRSLAQALMQGMDQDREAELAGIERGYKDADYARGRADSQQDYTRDRQDTLTDQAAGFQNKIDVKNAGNGTGPYQGNSMPAQNANILLNGDTSSPLYRAAYAQEAQPKITFDTNTNQMISVRPDMSAYRTPTGMPPSGQTGQAGIQPQPQQTSRQTPGQPTVTYDEGRGRTKGYSDAQNASAGYYERMLSANTAMDSVLAGKDGVIGTPDDVKYDDVNSFGQTIKNKVPLFGNNLISNDKQQLEQMQQDWVSAVLRKESGAVLGVDEIAQEKKKYFPQYGDSKETIARKSVSRQNAESGMFNASQGAWDALQETKKNKGQRKGDLPPGFIKDKK